LELGADDDVGGCHVAVGREGVGIEVVEAEGCCGDDAVGRKTLVGVTARV